MQYARARLRKDARSEIQFPKMEPGPYHRRWGTGTKDHLLPKVSQRRETKHPLHPSFAHANGTIRKLRLSALFANLFRVLGKDSTMTASRPPGGSVFLVEDEVMIRMMVADMLEELGYSVAAEAGEINEAIKLAQSTDFDIAILDVNVNGKVISPVAELIKARNRPFIFATGYGSQGLPEEYRDRPALQKPFQLESLGKMIESALRGATV
jgi:CheY-like chemotaxis protein